MRMLHVVRGWNVHRVFAIGAVLALAASSPALAGEAAQEAEKPAVADPAADKPAADHPAADKPVADKPVADKPVAEPAVTPYAAVRALQSLQDQVARGSASAQAAQAKMLVHVAEVFAEADPVVWKEQRNAGAAALYLFSSGRPAVVRAVLTRATLTPDGDRLIKGALAYAEGQDEIARVLLGKFDPRTMPASLGGHLALVTATLFAEKNPAKADAMLDVARLLVPGTLVEEAALRRQIFLLADPVSFDKFVALSRQYIRRFRRSVFAANFKGRLTSFAARIATSGDVSQMRKFDPIFDEMPQAERRALYLSLAREALVAGHTEGARYAATRAATLSPDAVETQRAKLYAAAATAASSDAPAARAALAAIDGTRLSPHDIELRDAALALAASVDGDLGDRGQPGQSAGQSDAPSDTPATALVERANRAMMAGDVLLASAPASSNPTPPAPVVTAPVEATP